MGGFGSGGHNARGHGTVEGSRSLDVNKLNKAGALSRGYRGGWRWSYDDGTEATIGLRMNDDRLGLFYRYRVNDGAWQDVNQPVPISWSPCRYGGRRPYFTCPGVVNGVPCGKRAAKLYGAGRYFLCRSCYGLTYRSQRERGMDRALGKANKVRMRLGGEPGMFSPFPDKPKGMHWRTYQRLAQEVADTEAVADEHLALVAARLLARFGPTGSNRGFWA